MAKKKDGKKEKNKMEGKAWATKILQLLGLATAVKAINGLITTLKKELALWVLEEPTGKTDKEYPYRQAGKIAGVLLQDNPQHEVDINALIGEIGLVNAVPFLSIKRTALVEAIKARKIPGITLDGLTKITKTTRGEPKIILYHGTLDMTQILPGEEEE